MKILIWNALTTSQGDVLFFNNAFSKTLLQQANRLSECGHQVEVIFTEATSQFLQLLRETVRPIMISRKEIVEALGSFRSFDEELYRRDETLEANLIKLLKGKLSQDYDAIIAWETPTNFLRRMCPNALMLNQMPGIFCKEPYPYMITFDLQGLYKEGTLFTVADDIKSYKALPLAKDFSLICQDALGNLFPFDDILAARIEGINQLKLLPLQVSGHYNFICDTKYKSQLDFLFDVMGSLPRDCGVVATQYVSRFISDIAINDSNLGFLTEQFPNLIYDSRFNQVSGVSQFWLPKVDSVITCSSSLGLQTLAFPNCSLDVRGDTFLKPYAFMSQKEKESALSFALNKHQVLASKALDGPWLSTFLEAAIKLKGEAKLIDRYPELQKMSSGYEQELFDSFKIENTKHSLVKQKIRTPSNFEVRAEGFKKKIADNKIKVISFDIFDTLISRSLVKPADLYLLLQQECFRLTNGSIDNFYLMRCHAEVNSRDELKSKETSLDRIYSYLHQKFQIPEEILEELKKLELKLEYDLSCQQKYGKILYEVARASKKKIIYTSDMYLPGDFIRRLLAKNGYDTKLPLYLSVECDCSKKEGGLFDYVLKHENLESYSEILHVGDNKYNDFEVPSSKGIETYRLDNPSVAMSRIPGWAQVLKNKTSVGESLLLGTIATNLYVYPESKDWSNSAYRNSVQNFGFSVVGPMIYAYIQWVAKKLKAQGTEVVLFLAREGKYCKNVYDQIQQSERDLPRSIYLYASRRSLNVASIESDLDIINIASSPFVQGSKAGDLLHNRFGILMDEIPEEYRNLELSSDQSDKVLFINIALNVKESIYKHSRKEREAYLQYLHGLGVNKKRIAIVDIGWKCRMQVKLSRLLGSKIDGYYYATINESEYGELLGNRIFSYSESRAGKFSQSFGVNNRHLLESVLCCSDETFICMSSCQSNGVQHLKPILSKSNIDFVRVSAAKELEVGINKFAQKILEVTSSLKGFVVEVTPSFVEGLLRSFLSKPEQVDMDVLKKFSFTDAIGGINTSRSVLVGSTKKQGKEVAKESKKTKQSVLRKIEKAFLRKVLSDKLFSKYCRDRDAYFRDSKLGILKIYYKVVK